VETVENLSDRAVQKTREGIWLL